MGLGDFLKDVVTFGGHSTLQEVQAAYEQNKVVYDEVSIDYDTKQTELKDLVRNIIKVRTKALKTVKKAKQILNSLSIRDREKLEYKVQEESDYSFTEIETVVTMDEISYDGVVNNIFESTAGSLGFLGDSGILDDLDGKEKSKVAGAVALAAAAVTAVVNVVSLNVETRKQISTYREQNVKVVEAIAILKRENFKYDLVSTRLREIFQSINKGLEAFEYVFNDTAKAVNPLGLISVFLRNLRSKEKRRLLDSQLEKINTMIGSIGSVLKMVDSLPPLHEVMAAAKQLTDKEYKEKNNG
jgi:hypothetical protein